MRAVLLAILPLLAATLAPGCLDVGGPAPVDSNESPDAGDGTTPPTSTSPPADAPPEEPEPGFRVLATGSHSAMPYPLRLVLEEPEEWATFWREHHGNASGEPPAPPEVDFARERVAVATLGDRPDGCWHVRATDLTQEGHTALLEVTTYRPDVTTVCGAVVTQPYVMVAIPAGEAEVAFRDVEKTGAPAA